MLGETRCSAFDVVQEARIVHMELQTFTMDQKLDELEVEKTKNLGNMTNALLMMASSMDNLTRVFILPSCLVFHHCVGVFVQFGVMVSSTCFLESLSLCACKYI